MVQHKIGCQERPDKKSGYFNPIWRRHAAANDAGCNSCEYDKQEIHL